MTADADVIILGGGCAGLSLATALAGKASGLRVHILESRETYGRDRTWCFWNTEPHLFSAGITHRWSSWRVRGAGAEARQGSSRYTYDHLPADRFYELATASIRQAGHVLSMGVDVRALRQQEDRCEVESNAGTLRSRWIFDSRPRAAAALRPVLLQRFVGWHLRTSNACFDPSVVDLMDFQPAAETEAESGRNTFFYVLPFSPTEALVEATFLDDPALSPAEAEAALRQYLGRLPTGGYEVLYTETGALPMGERVPQTLQPGRSGETNRMIEIGTRGGRVKPSSGYAFLRIQRQSAALAEALAAGAPLPTVFEPPFYRLLDSIFLRALKRTPERAPLYFMSMFRQLPPDLLVRFLSESAAPGEVLRVMLTLPKLDFLQAALLPAKACPA